MKDEKGQKEKEEKEQENLKGKEVNMKTIRFILQKSSELEKKHALISFFCLLYAVEKLNVYVKKNPSDKAAKEIFLSSLTLAEKRRPAFAKLDEEELATFCKKLFAASNESDRTEQPPNKTLLLFYTSQTFYEILNHFRSLNEEEKKIYIYAKYKTVYLKKCIDAGIKPTPGTPEKEKGPTVAEDTTAEYAKENFEENYKRETTEEENCFDMNQELYSVMNNETITSIQKENIKPKEEKSNIKDEKSNIKDEKNNIKDEKIKTKEEEGRDLFNSMKHAQYAVNALMFEDAETAIKELKEALTYLGEK